MQKIKRAISIGTQKHMEQIGNKTARQHSGPAEHIDEFSLLVEDNSI